jgi:hypothetical protein
MMRFKEVALSNASPEAKIAGLAVLLDKELLRLSEVVLNTKKLQGPQGEQGLQGPKGEQGDRGFDGANGKDGSNGKDGKDGEEGKQGVGVQDAKIDFDGSLVITLTDGTEINAGDVVPMDAAEKIRVIGNGGGTSQYVLDAIEAINTVIDTYGTIVTQDADAVAITGGTIDGTTIGAVTPAAGTFTTLTATGQTSLGGVAGAESLRVNTTASAVNWVEVTGGASGSSPTVKAAGAGRPLVLSGGSGSNGVNFYSNNLATQQFQVAHTATAVNYVQVTGAATTAFPTISAQGSDSAVSLGLTAKGGNAIIFFTNSGSNRGLRVSHTASSVNYVDVSGSATGSVPVIGNAGSDSNIGLALKTTGTGAIDLAAGSSGVNISNGGTVTAITRTAGGGNYTSIPTIAIGAPTTAGGVQAVISIASMFTSGGTIQSGGTGYTVGNTLTLVGGTPVGVAATYTVSAVSGGVVTAVTTGNFAPYSTLPTAPVSVTGGTGTGFTFNPFYGVNTLSITNAGSGYVEQPTVTFSGGGGSGAAAHATVGSGSVIRALGSTSTQALDFSVASSIANNNYPVLRIKDTNIGAGTNAGYLMAQNNNGYAQLIAQGGSTNNAALFLASNGSGDIRFNTNSTAETNQMRVTHTASAVNYVQVTGAATGGRVTISSQGSDTNVPMIIGTKGSGSLNVRTDGSASTQFAVTHTSSAANYINVTGGAATNSPVISALGSDTNIDLTLTPKGTGNVRFGTLTASADAAITGYITIKDSGGTVRKLAVIA